MTNLMNTLIRLFVTVLLSSQALVAQVDTTRREFYPLHLGDLWQYLDEFGRVSTFLVAVVDTTLDNGQHYAGLRPSPYFGYYLYYRIDSVLRVQNRRGFGGDSCGGTAQNEVNTYRLGEVDSTVWHDCINFGGYLTPNALVRYDGIRLMFVFGEWRETMIFEFGGVFPAPVDTFFGSYAYLVRGIGLLWEEYYETRGYRLLTGAVINGIQYGTVDVEELSAGQYLREFKLSQNYPNPFNPSTTIWYSLPQRSFATLKVYNLLGQEVATLVEDEVNPGRHSIDWNAEGKPSGVYFCRLVAGDRVASIQLLLLR